MFNQDLATYNFLRQKLIHVKSKVVAQKQSTDAPTATK